MALHDDILSYNNAQAGDARAICTMLAGEIDKALASAENKI